MERRAHVFRTRRLFGRMMGPMAVTVQFGPMKGIKPIPSERVSHAHVRGIHEIGTQETLDCLEKPRFICYDLGASICYLSLLEAYCGR